MPDGYLRGNTGDPDSPAQHFRGWIIGELDKWTNGNAEKELVASAAELLVTDRVAVKFQTEAQGEFGPKYFDQPEKMVTLALLLFGELRINLVDRADGREHIQILEKFGDYLAWSSQKYSHSWEALNDSTVLTVRWAE